MPLYALEYRYVDDAELVTRHRPEHRAYLRQIADAGQLILAGPLAAPGAGGLLIFDVESQAAVEELADSDPFQIRGIIAGRSVRQWTLSIGEERLGPSSTTGP
ncbi:YciI family protein (plasmid) [Rhodococcus erythropolis]|uniref:YciI family protein n=1 Tax=Rhodococcus erythropolis TaxID=1833 RepID=UPI00406BC6DA